MERKHLTLFAAFFLASVGLLAAGYFLVLRPDFAVLYENIREADAAQIVSELEQRGIEYRLEDEGRRILVPRGNTGEARILIAGSGIAMGGIVGFELFNETDMGLTEFAQKVNYQRALQGELARTIMSMEDIEFARVHLSLPERTLFRASQQAPKAAVTLQTVPRFTVDASRVSGIQQLVSSAVIDLPAAKVAVLDDRGRLLSVSPVSEDEVRSALSEKQALEEYYRAGIRSVAERLLPGLHFSVRVFAMELAERAATEDPEPAIVAETGEEPGAADQERNFLLRIAFRTESPINPDDREMLQGAITEVAGLSSDIGDTLRFETGTLESGSMPPASMPVASAQEPDIRFPIPAVSPLLNETRWSEIAASRWTWIALAALLVMVLIWLRRRSRLGGEEQQRFADLLSETVAMREEPSHAR